MLQLNDLCAAYGNIRALINVSMEISEGTMVAIVGPNGAGKSTLFKVISGVVPATTGSVRFRGADLLALDPSARAALGLAHVPEGRQVFKAMTVVENIQMGAYSLRSKAEKNRALDDVLTVFPMLAQRRYQQAGFLSGGQQQMLAIGRALASRPKVLMLDEPSLGLSPIMADLMFDQIAAIRRDSGLTIILVEQRVAESLEACDWGYVLDNGRIVLQGEPGTLMRDDRVRSTYMGMGGCSPDEAG